MQDSWLGAQFDETLLATIVYWVLVDKIDAIVKKSRALQWVKRLRYFSLALFREFMRTRNISTEELLTSRSKLSEIVDEFWKLAFRELVTAYEDATQRDGTTLFALARSESRWASVKSRFQTYLAGTD